MHLLLHCQTPACRCVDQATSLYQCPGCAVIEVVCVCDSLCIDAVRMLLCFAGSRQVWGSRAAPRQQQHQQQHQPQHQQQHQQQTLVLQVNLVLMPWTSMGSLSSSNHSRRQHHQQQKPREQTLMPMLMLSQQTQRQHRRAVAPPLLPLPLPPALLWPWLLQQQQQHSRPSSSSSRHRRRMASTAAVRSLMRGCVSSRTLPSRRCCSRCRSSECTRSGQMQASADR